MDFELSPIKAMPSRRVSWVEVFSLSAVGHGLVVGMVLIVWMGLNPQSQELAGKNGGDGGEALCFWDNSIPEKPAGANQKKTSDASTETNSDLVPFTIQMSPIGLAERFAPIGGQSSIAEPFAKSHESGRNGDGNWFDSSQLPEKTAWLIDCSLSMGIHSHFDKARRQLQISMSQLSPPSKARIWAFAKYPREIAGTGDWSYWTPVRNQIAGLDLEKTIPAGNTDLASALRVVISTSPDLIQILTDEDQLSEKELAALRRFHSRQAKPMPRMRVIVMTKPASETPLQTFCRQAGCSYQVIPGAGDLR